MAGVNAGQVIAGRERFGVLVRYPPELRDSPDMLRSVFVTTPSGAQIALGDLTRVEVVEGVDADQVRECEPRQRRVRGRSGE